MPMEKENHPEGQRRVIFFVVVVIKNFLIKYSFIVKRTSKLTDVNGSLVYIIYYENIYTIY